MTKLIAKLRSWFRSHESVDPIGLPTNVDLRDPEQKPPPVYTGPKLVVKSLRKENERQD